MLGLALGAIGLGISTLGGISASKAAKQLARYNADLIKWEGEINLIRHRKEARALIGAQASAYAKAGVMTTEGSAADVIRDTAIQAEHDALALKYQTEQKVYITKKGGQAQSQNIMYSTIGNLFSGAGGMVK